MGMKRKSNKTSKNINIAQWHEDALVRENANLSALVRDMLDLRYSNHPDEMLLLKRKKELESQKEFIEAELELIENRLEQSNEIIKETIEKPSKSLESLYDGYSWRYTEKGEYTANDYLDSPAAKELLTEAHLSRSQFLNYFKKKTEVE